jgi:hypothetical protein
MWDVALYTNWQVLGCKATSAGRQDAPWQDVPVIITGYFLFWGCAVLHKTSLGLVTLGSSCLPHCSVRHPMSPPVYTCTLPWGIRCYWKCLHCIPRRVGFVSFMDILRCMIHNYWWPNLLETVSERLLKQCYLTHCMTIVFTSKLSMWH